MSHSNTSPVRKLVPLTTRSSSLWCVLAAEHYTAELYSIRGRTKPWGHLSRSDMSSNTRAGVPQDTKSFRSCYGNRAKMHLKGHLGFKCHFQYIKLIRLLQHSWMGCAWPGYIVCDMETITVLVILAFNFIPQRSRLSPANTQLVVKYCPNKVSNLRRVCRENVNLPISAQRILVRCAREFAQRTNIWNFVSQFTTSCEAQTRIVSQRRA